MYQGDYMTKLKNTATPKTKPNSNTKSTRLSDLSSELKQLIITKGYSTVLPRKEIMNTLNIRSKILSNVVAKINSELVKNDKKATRYTLVDTLDTEETSLDLYKQYIGSTTTISEAFKRVQDYVSVDPFPNLESIKNILNDTDYKATDLIKKLDSKYIIYNTLEEAKAVKELKGTNFSYKSLLPLFSDPNLILTPVLPIKLFMGYFKVSEDTVRMVLKDLQLLDTSNEDLTPEIQERAKKLVVVSLSKYNVYLNRVSRKIINELSEEQSKDLYTALSKKNAKQALKYRNKYINFNETDEELLTEQTISHLELVLTSKNLKSSKFNEVYKTFFSLEMQKNMLEAVKEQLDEDKYWVMHSDEKAPKYLLKEIKNLSV